MDLNLRQEQTSDYCETENVTREAFWNHFSSGCDEHYLVHIVRTCQAFVPELDVVATYDGKVVGNSICVKGVIKGDDGNEYEVLSLGPISVLPAFQRSGVGGKLIEYTKTQAREMGFRAILLYGDPDYYERKGFVAAETLGIRTADNMYATAFQVYELYENALAGTDGRYFEDAIYEIDESKLTEFDKKFPIKEKVVGTPSQIRFNRISTMRRTCPIVSP